MPDFDVYTNPSGERYALFTADDAEIGALALQGIADAYPNAAAGCRPQVDEVVRTVERAVALLVRDNLILDTDSEIGPVHPDYIGGGWLSIAQAQNYTDALDTYLELVESGCFLGEEPEPEPVLVYRGPPMMYASVFTPPDTGSGTVSTPDSSGKTTFPSYTDDLGGDDTDDDDDTGSSWLSGGYEDDDLGITQETSSNTGLLIAGGVVLGAAALVLLSRGKK